MLEEAKNERLSQLLAQTDAYLEQIGKLLHIQKGRDEISEKKKEREERNKRFMERREAEKAKKLAERQLKQQQQQLLLLQQQAAQNGQQISNLPGSIPLPNLLQTPQNGIAPLTNGTMPALDKNLVPTLQTNPTLANNNTTQTPTPSTTSTATSTTTTQPTTSTEPLELENDDMEIDEEIPNEEELEEENDATNANNKNMTASEKNKKYYNLAHTIEENVTEQPTMLKGGKLKKYQV